MSNWTPTIVFAEIHTDDQRFVHFVKVDFPRIWIGAGLGTFITEETPSRRAIFLSFFTWKAQQLLQILGMKPSPGAKENLQKILIFGKTFLVWECLTKWQISQKLEFFIDDWGLNTVFLTHPVASSCEKKEARGADTPQEDDEKSQDCKGLWPRKANIKASTGEKNIKRKTWFLVRRTSSLVQKNTPVSDGASWNHFDSYTWCLRDFCILMDFVDTKHIFCWFWKTSSGDGRVF